MLFLRRHRKVFHEYRSALYDRLVEPLHVNLISIFVALFGDLRRKIDFDLVLRKQHAYAMLNLADQAKSLGYERATIIEFGGLRARGC